MAHPKYKRLVDDLREHANRDDIDHQICFDCDDAAEAIQRMRSLLGVIDANGKHSDPQQQSQWIDRVVEAREELR